MKDQFLKKIYALAVASLFVLSLASTADADTIINEKFSSDPLANGWQIFGDTNLFQWDAASQALDVTWDSSQTNSYFYHPLGQTFTLADGFCVQFDLNLADVNATNYFQVAIGLCNLAEATSTNFSRANGASPDLFEFDYYPDGPASDGPSLDATLVDSADNFYFAFDATQPLLTNTDYRVVLIHQPGAAAISATVYTNGQVFTKFPSVANYGPGDFNLDTLAIENYTTLDDIYGDSLLAHGVVSHLSFASPLPVGMTATPAAGQVQFIRDTNWLYTLEQTADFKSWTPAAAASFGNGTNLTLQATNAPADKSFYRVRADLP